MYYIVYALSSLSDFVTSSDTCYRHACNQLATSSFYTHKLIYGWVYNTIKTSACLHMAS